MVSFFEEQKQRKKAEQSALQTKVSGLHDELQRREKATPEFKQTFLRQQIQIEGGKLDQLGIELSILNNIGSQIQSAKQKGFTISDKEQERFFTASRSRVGRAKTMALIREREQIAALQTARKEAAKKGLEPIRVRGRQRFRDIRTKKLIPLRAPTISIKKLAPRKIMLPSKKQAIIFGDPVNFAKSYRNATGSNSFTIAIPQRRQNGKILVQDFNFRFENGRLVKAKPTGSALITEERYLAADKRRRDKNPGFTFGDTRLKKEEKKITDKELSKILQLSIDPKLKFFNKEQLREEAGLRRNVDTFSKQRLDFYQGQINKGIISVEHANRLLEKDIDKRINTEVEKSEFFREKNKRESTLTRLAFQYETDRIAAVKKGNKAQAGSLRFLRNMADTPSAFVELGKEVNRLIKNPENFVPLTASIRASITKDNLALTSGKIKNFVMTRPGEAIAEVGGTILIFGATAKGLKLVAQLSKPTSANIIKRLKINTGLKGGLKGIPVISAKVTEGVVKAAGIPPKIRVPKAFSKAFNEAVKTSKITKTLKKAEVKAKVVKKVLTAKEIKIRVKKQSLLGRAAIRLKKRKIAEEKLKLQRRIIKRRKEKERRRKKLLKEKKKKKRIAKLKKAKVVVAAKRVKARVKAKLKALKKKPIVKKIKKKKLELKKKKERKLLVKRVSQRRKERLARRKRLLKEQKFSRSKLGKLKKRATVTIARLNKRMKELEAIEELPPGTIKKLKSQTKKVIAKIRQRNVKVKDIKKLEDIHKLALSRSKKAQKKEIKRIQADILTPEKLLKQIRKSQALKKQQINIKKKIKKSKRLSSIQQAALGRAKSQQKKAIKRIQKKVLSPQRVIKRARQRENLRRQQRNLNRKIKKASQPSPIQKATLGRLTATERKRIVSSPGRRPRLVTVSPREEMLRKINERIKSLTPARRRELEKRIRNIRKRIEAQRFKINNQLLEQTKLTSIQKLALKRSNQKTKQLAKQDKTLGKEIKVMGNQQRQILRSKIKPRAKQQQLLKLKQKQSQALRTRKNVQRSISASKFRTIQLVTAGLLSRQRQQLRQLIIQAQVGKLTSKQRAALKQLQAEAQALLQAQKITTAAPKPGRAVITPALKPAKAILLKRKKKRIKKVPKAKKVKAYHVFAKPVKGKKLIRITKRPLRKSDALDRGAYAIDKSLSATFKLKSAGKLKRVGVLTKGEKGRFKKTKKKFRSYRIVKGKRVPLKRRYIEKKGRPRIDTRGEKRGLTLRRLAKQKGFIKKPSRKKRVLTRGFTKKPVTNKKKGNPTKKNIKKVRGFSNTRKRRKS